MEINEDKINGTFEGFTPFQLKCKFGYVVGTYQHKENRLCIGHAMCQGCFKELMNYLIDKFHTNNILIYNVMNLSNWHKLRGFNKITMIDPYFKEEVICLQGNWINDDVGTNKRILIN